MIFSTSPPGSTTIASKDSESPGVEGNTGGRFQKSKISNCGVAHCVSAQWNCNFICLFFNQAQHVFCMSILGDAGEGGRGNASEQNGGIDGRFGLGSTSW